MNSFGISAEASGPTQVEAPKWVQVRSVVWKQRATSTVRRNARLHGQLVHRSCVAVHPGMVLVLILHSHFPAGAPRQFTRALPYRPVCSYATAVSSLVLWVSPPTAVLSISSGFPCCSGLLWGLVFLCRASSCLFSSAPSRFSCSETGLSVGLPSLRWRNWSETLADLSSWSAPESPPGTALGWLPAVVWGSAPHAIRPTPSPSSPRLSWYWTAAAASSCPPRGRSALSFLLQ